MTDIPKWLMSEDSTRKRSNKQESRLAKRFSGRKTCNSGAKFGENDVESSDLSIEAKTTSKKSYILKVDEFNEIIIRTPSNKIPTQIIEFSEYGLELAVIPLNFLLELINK